MLKFFIVLTWSHINPPTHQIIHPPMGGGVSTDSKSSNRIEISWLVQVLLNFYWFQVSPLGDGSGWMRWGWWEGAPHTCVHACSCTHVHMGMTSYRIPRDSSIGAAICMKLSCLPCMHVCVCVCVCMCMHVHARAHVWEAPPTTPHLIQPATGSPNHQNSISLELIKIIQFCLKILYLWTLLNSYRL